MDDVKFPNFSQKTLIFPIPWAPAPFPKKGVRALNEIFLLPSIFNSYIYEMKGCFCIFTKIWNEMTIK